MSCGFAIDDLCSLDSDQARQNVGPDLDPNCFEKVNFEKNSAQDKKNTKIPSMQRVHYVFYYRVKSGIADMK